MRADVTAEIAQVVVRPRRTDLAIQAGLGMFAVPAEAEAVAIGGGCTFECADALLYQRMRWRSHIMLEGGLFTAIGNPASHEIQPL